MIRRKGPPAQKRYVVDRYDPTRRELRQRRKSLSPKGDPIFRDLSEDAGGNLHAVWVQNDDSHEPLYVRQSADGRSWSPKRPRWQATAATALQPPRRRRLRTAAAGRCGTPSPAAGR